MATLLEVRENLARPYHRWTVEDYHRMVQTGLLDETDRVELIEGELIDMAPIGCKHASRVDKLARALLLALGMDYLVRVQNPVTLGGLSEPQPDIVVVRDGDYSLAHPSASDIFLLVEVADATLHFDREVKLALYARHGIPEVWLLDVATDQLTIHCDPADGQYRTLRTPAPDEPIAPQRLPQAVITLAEIMR
ncbi:MAG: Uma2 family endonuclease [Rhodocyclaceae bacterium]|nr:Uma2 family endonuclease [Rhodocyclaceae bacterium]